MISTIYHVVSLLGTAQRLLLGLYMEEMKNRTLGPGELSPFDFFPPELLGLTHRQRMDSPSPPDWDDATPVYTLPPEEELAVFSVPADPNDVFDERPTLRQLIAASTRPTTEPPWTLGAWEEPKVDLKAKYWATSPRPRLSVAPLITAAPSPPSRPTDPPLPAAPVVDAAFHSDLEGSGEGCGVGGCAPRPDLAADSGRSCRQNSDCRRGQKCMAENCVLAIRCPKHLTFGTGPPEECEEPRDPFKLPKSPIEKWLTREVYYDLFPKANIGHGPHKCSPYSYEAFVIAARYFPRFGEEKPGHGYTGRENARRDLAAFFAHAVQETGENDASLYATLKKKEEADACFYRGGFFNWFEGGPTSSFLPQETPGHQPEDGETCISAGKYCASGAELDYWFPCNNDNTTADAQRARKRRAKSDEFFKGCYFGRGAIQISYNYNYGQFQNWLTQHRIHVDLLKEPNLVMTKKDPPLAVLPSLWFYMTPQPPKPAMHDIVVGEWEPGPENRAEGYAGPVFGPTSLVINNECGGEDEKDPGGPGESRRIKAFKWFCEYFNVPVEEARLLSCKGMPKLLDGIKHPLSYQPDWTNTWKEQSCDCAPANYGGMIPFFEEGHYPSRFVDENLKNRIRCVYSVYDNPSMYGMDNKTSACLNYPIPHNLRKQFLADPARRKQES